MFAQDHLCGFTSPYTAVQLANAGSSSPLRPRIGGQVLPVMRGWEGFLFSA